ncbi:MAG TPA: hypothetical protein VG502_16090 [Flexivirga sp.]|uniref:hypothetical protein n=1 Tax=Flexivirga sp. TaxID=1962927 RepID=UPI002C74889A|nr:hypothetical protein [Flexivirga sp.]HWC23816.1 hypothetical protein [Flexivirga sp.]
MDFVVAAVLVLFAYATGWNIRRSRRDFRRDGHLRVTARGLSFDIRRRWILWCYLGFAALMGFVAVGVAVRLLVDAIR